MAAGCGCTLALRHRSPGPPGGAGRLAVLSDNLRARPVACADRVRADLATAHTLRAESGDDVLWHHFVHTPHLRHLKLWADWHYSTDAEAVAPHELMGAIMTTAAGDVDLVLGGRP